MLLTNSWITTLLIIEKGTGFNADVRAGTDASSTNGSDYGAAGGKIGKVFAYCRKTLLLHVV